MKKNKLASALKYNIKDDCAPRVIAQGKGEVAERIESLAKESDIPVYKDEKLARQLDYLSIGQEIPERLYNVVAEILAFIAELDNGVR